jgi:hypothetical protein
MRTAPPRPRNNAFGQGSRLVRRAGYLRLLLELPADLLTKLFARAKLVRLAAGKILFRAGAPGDGCYKNRPLASPRQLPHDRARILR